MKAPAGAPDSDYDGIADMCDGDSDGDGGLDQSDRHSHQASVPGGPVLNACGGTSTWSYRGHRRRCNEQILKFVDIVDPERSIVLAHYTIVNDRKSAIPSRR